LLILLILQVFLDGDGSIIARIVRRDDYKWGFQITVTVQFTQKTCRRVFLQKLLTLIGIGCIRDRTNFKTAVSDYTISSVKDVYSLLKELQPYLRIKQKQANLVISLIEQMPLAKNSQEKFIQLCLIVDQVAALNDSKTRKITSHTVIEHLKTL
jgi:hypothetical protein